MELATMLFREMLVREDVLGRLLEQRRGLGQAAPEAVGDLLELRPRTRTIRLREDRPHDGGNRFPRGVGHGRQQIPHEVDAAALPGRATQDGADRLFQAFMRIRDHQAHAPQPPLDEAAQERGSEAGRGRLGLFVLDIVRVLYGYPYRCTYDLWA